MRYLFFFKLHKTYCIKMEAIENGTQVKAPGFHVIHLPFLDDIRSIPERRLTTDNPP